MSHQNTVVRRLSLRVPAGEAAGAAARVGRLAARVELSASFLNPAAILCIRRLPDPRPRTLALAGWDLHPSRDWEAAARSTMSGLADRAARPALGPVPASAAAVLFADRAEMLACLARDWCDGLVGSCWWWRAVFPATDVAAAVVRAWRETPEQMPAACQLLATWGRLAPFIRRLAPADVASLTHGVARAFGLQAVVGVLAMRGTQPSVSGALPEETGAAATSWLVEPHLPETTIASLAPEQRVFAMVNLALHGAPSDAPRMLSAATVTSRLKNAPEREPQREPFAAAAPATAPRREERGRPTATEPVRASGHEAPADAGVEMSAVPAPEVPGGAATIERFTEVPATPSSSVVQPLAESGTSGTSTDPEPRRPRTLRPVEAIVETAFGGAFYLINVGIALGLYGDFTMPLAPGLDLPIWDFIALITTRLVPNGGEPLAADPLLPFLARLAGRAPSEAPGAHRVPPRTWTLPAEWQVGLDEPGGAATYDQWADWLTPRIADRLARALRVEAHAAGTLLIRCGARVSLSPSHLDVSVALDDLPIEVRLAGLDRNPGFVPAAALTIGFSYV